MAFKGRIINPEASEKARINFTKVLSQLLNEGKLDIECLENDSEPIMLKNISK